VACFFLKVTKAAGHKSLETKSPNIWVLVQRSAQ